jgi:hypothetical protein
MRGLALFLLALAVVLLLVGIIGTVVALQNLGGGNGDVGVLVAFLVLDAVGTGLLIASIAMLRRTKPLGETTDATAGQYRTYPAKVPVPAELDGAPYTVLYTPPVKGKHAKPSSLTVTTPVASTGEFHMAPETWFDRMCKRWGLAREIHSGDEAFDAECYVRSDAVEFAEAYLADPVKRVAILDLRRFGFPTVTMKDGSLSATWVGFDPAKHDQPELAEDVAARLVLLSRNLPAHRPEFDNRAGTHRKQFQVVYWAFLALFGATILSLIGYPPIHGSDLVVPALIVLVIGLPVFAYVSALTLAGTSTSHYAWGALMIGALFLFPLGSFGTITLINGVADDAPEVTHRAKIVERYTTRSKNSTNYHVRCESWRDPGDTESFQVSFADWNATVPNKSKLVVVTRAGALGIEWRVSKHVDARGK